MLSMIRPTPKTCPVASCTGNQEAQPEKAAASPSWAASASAWRPRQRRVGDAGGGDIDGRGRTRLGQTR